MSDSYRGYLTLGAEAGMGYKLTPPQYIPHGQIGEQAGSRPGSSLEFMDHRNYMPGDDLRRIDWAAYARSDKLTVRLYREEIDPHVEIILDSSASMALSGSEKAGGTAAVAALAAQSAANAGFSYKVWLAGDTCQDLPNSSAHPSHWQGLRFDSQNSPAAALTRPARRMRSRAMRLLVSDLLWPGDPMQTMLTLTRDASTVFVVQILAQADVDPPGPGNLRMTDAETGERMEVFIDTAARQRYLERLARHQQHWREACRHCGATLTILIAEEFLSRPRVDEWIKMGILR